MGKNIAVQLIGAFFTMTLLVLPVSAYAAWTEPAPVPNFNPGQGQSIHHEVHMNAAPVTMHVELQPRVQQLRTVVHNTLPAVDRNQTNARHDQPVKNNQAADHHQTNRLNRDPHQDIRHEDIFINNVVPPVIDPGISVPDGLESIVVDGQTYFYAQGVFYQQQGDQLVPIAPVLGAVVDSIPEGYVVITADGVNYLFVDGIYFERVEQGFEVVTPPFLEAS